mgnify:FL=1
MAKQVLPTNFMDDILNESMNGKRRWTITQNDDGTYTLEDATTYDQLGNTFGQAQVNAMNKAINESVDQARVIDDYKTLAAVNQNGFVPGAKPVAQLISDLNQRFPDGTGLQWDGTNFWGTTADGMKVKLGSLTYRDFTVTPTANSGSMSIDISDIPNYKDLILWETLFPRMLSDLDIANWNTSMLRTGVGYDWNYDADKGILSISSRHTECVLIQYGTGLKQRTVRVHYI